MSDHTSIGIHAGPLFGALGVVVGHPPRRGRPARACSSRSRSRDAAASFDWFAAKGSRRTNSPRTEVTGNKADNYKRRPPGTGGMKEAVRYQMYESADGHVLFMASEQEFWKNFCAGIDRMDLFEADPGSTYADHASGNNELRASSREIFKTRTTAEWIEFGQEAGTPIAPVNSPRTLADDPQFQDRLGWLPRRRARHRAAAVADQGRRRGAGTARARHPCSTSTPTKCCRRFSDSIPTGSRSCGPTA